LASYEKSISVPSRKNQIRINYEWHSADIDIMKNRFAFTVCLFFSFLLLLIEGEAKARKEIPPAESIPILLYHRFGPAVADSMTLPTSVFEAHLKFLHDQAYTVITLRELVDNYFRNRIPPAPRSVAITVDDGHKSVYTDMFPLIKKYRIPVTLFLYPSSISNASYALTWDQLRKMKDTGLFDFQSHSYWHPNFKKEREKLKAAEYEKFVEKQLKKSKETLEKNLNAKVNMLAWPFGIYDAWLMAKATEAGYGAAFTIDRRHATLSDQMAALPRFLLTGADRGNVFAGILAALPSKGK
jgi:peptidoglycan/xylan/chitin deacetylase (PgdA/CDA1 family)